MPYLLPLNEKWIRPAITSRAQRVTARAGDASDFSSLQARVNETETDVRRVFLACCRTLASCAKF